MKAWEKNIRKVVPYVPGEQPNQIGMIKLNTNENPYPPAPGVQEAIKNLDDKRMRLYPDPTAEALVNELAAFYHLDKNQIFVGVGSDDVLAMCFLTFFNSDRPVFSRISPILFMMYGQMYFGFRTSASRLMRIFRL